MDHFIESPDYSIVTLPRVGSNYLQDRIFQHTGIFVQKYHKVQDNNMITIVRDPIELLTSELAMGVFYDPEGKKINDRRKQLWEVELQRDYMKYLSDKDDMDVIDDFHTVIDYRTLIAFPYETTQAVASIMGLEIIQRDYTNSRLRNYEEYKHILSSKKVKEYDDIKEHLHTMDLSRMYEFYNKMLAKCIDIPGTVKP
jgi:hypothetical protein